jgi:hypothetical protein
MSSVERNRDAAQSPGSPSGYRRAPGELAQLTGELTGPVDRDRRLMIEPITSHDIDLTLDHEPGRREQFSKVIHHLSRRKVSRFTLGEAPGRRNLCEVEYRKHLIRAGFYETHRVTPGENCRPCT